MSLYSTAVKKPVTTLMIFIGILVLGVYSLLYIPVDFFPEFDPPVVSVFTFYEGANASDIEENVTKRLENSFSTLSNLKEITSNSKDNISVIILEFEWGSNLDEATNEIRDALSRSVRYLPEEATEPTILKFSSSMIPIMMFSATADENYPALIELLEDKLINPINRIDGVGAVSIMGGPKRAIMVDIDPRKLDAYNLSLEQLAGILAAENLNLPAGNVKMGQVDYALRIQGEFANSNMIKNIIISNVNDKPVYLKDVATVRDDLKELNIDERINGNPGVRVMIQKQTGANTVEVAKLAKEKIEELEKTLPPDVKIEIIFDTSDYITGSISNLSQTLMYAGIFVVLVVLFFLGRWRATFIIVLTIPVALIGAFIFLFVTGDSINVVSLSALSIAIGMVVDDAIVVLENITKNLEKGSYPREAAIYGTNEVGLAVVATTLTVLAVFFPLTMLGGMTGELFKPLGYIVCITIGLSTIAALTLTPMLSSKLLRLKKWDKKSFNGKFAIFNQKILNKLDDIYVKTLAYALRHRGLVVIISVIIFGSSFFLIKVVGSEFMPPSDNGRISAKVELIQGVRLDETKKIAREIENIISEKYPEINMVSTSSGAGDEESIASVFSESGSYIINFMMSLSSVDERERDIFLISELLREDLSKFPEITKYNVDPGGSRGGSTGSSGGANTVEVKIFGYDFDETSILAEQVSGFMEEMDATIDIIVDRDKEKPELQIILDREKMSSLGLNTAAVSGAVRNRINGLTATKYREEGEEYDIILRYEEQFRNSTSDIENITIQNPRGKLIKLKEVANIEQYYSPPSIKRENKERVVTISALVEGDLGEATSLINKNMDKLDIPDGVMYEIGGSAQDMQDSFRDLGLLLVLSIVLVYIVMASQFESFREPFIIMFSLPFAFTGVFLALAITGTTLNVISLIGGVMLVGIVVKNGIVLVDYTNLLRERDITLWKAILDAGRSRLRPVLMTTLTTLLAMLPLAVSQGEGAEIWRPMGISIIGGLLFSTMVTLILIPIIYSFFGTARMKRATKSVLVESNNNNN